MKGLDITFDRQKKLVHPLLKWFEQNKRDLPWRKTSDPYKIWISEIMLQQTQVEQVIPYYIRFLKKFPNVKELAQSKLDDILKVWEGLGYYRRARYIHEGALAIVNKFGGTIPRNYEELNSLPGFGPYTCGSVLSIAYNLPFPAIDGNVIRFISRLFRIESDVALPATKSKIDKIVRELIPLNKASQFAQALMEMGATVCKPLHPSCISCCCRKVCRAYNEIPNPAVIPKKKKKTKGPRVHIAAGIVGKGRAVLISKRPADVILGNLWEFPGGKKEKGESLGTACIRELYNKTGIEVKLVKPFSTVKHNYSHYSVTIHFFSCTYIKGIPKNSAIRWVKLKDLDNYAFSKVHKQVMLIIRDAEHL